MDSSKTEVSLEAAMTLLMVEELEHVAADILVQTKAETFNRLLEIIHKYQTLSSITNREKQVLMPISLVDSMRASAVRYDIKPLPKTLNMGKYQGLQMTLIGSTTNILSRGHGKDWSRVEFDCTNPQFVMLRTMVGDHPQIGVLLESHDQVRELVEFLNRWLAEALSE